MHREARPHLIVPAALSLFAERDPLICHIPTAAASQTA
jgi:hypothetical protein